MTDALPERATPSVGDTVTIYQDPITQLDPEGKAVVVEVRRVESWGEAICNVRFVDDGPDGGVYQRSVYPAPYSPAAPGA